MPLVCSQLAAPNASSSERISSAHPHTPSLHPCLGSFQPDFGPRALGESGLVQTWFSESVGDESYHCYLPASPPPLAVRIVLPDGTDAASRDTVLGNVVKVLANKGFSVKVSSWAPDVFILSAESAPASRSFCTPPCPTESRG